MDQESQSGGRRRRQRGRAGQGPALGGRQALEVDVARGLRRLRAKHGLTLRTLAETSGLAVNTLSLIENRKISPSVSTLQQVAVALGEPITAFFEEGAVATKVVFGRAHQRPRARFAHGSLEDLGTELQGANVLPLMVNLNPNADSGEVPIVHTGYEFVYCLSGQVEYIVEGRVYAMAERDTLFFEANLPHRWRNPEATPAEMLLILSPSDARDQPAERHFAVGELLD